MGIANKCFEILENKHGWETRPESHLGQTGHDSQSSDAEDEADEADDDIADDEDDIDDADDDEAGDETESDSSSGGGDDSESDVVEASNHARLRLREILFYDDKVAVFRARHGRL